MARYKLLGPTWYQSFKLLIHSQSSWPYLISELLVTGSSWPRTFFTPQVATVLSYCIMTGFGLFGTRASTHFWLYMKDTLMYSNKFAIGGLVCFHKVSRLITNTACKTSRVHFMAVLLLRIINKTAWHTKLLLKANLPA